MIRRDRIPTPTSPLDDIQLGDIEQWMRPDREGIFAKLRAERPISFHEELEPPPEMASTSRRARASGRSPATPT